MKKILILIILSYLFFMFGNRVLYLTNPDEVFYAQTAKEMAQKNTWMVPYIFGQPQFEKPIFTYWLIRISFMVFGVSDFAARFFPTIFGILGVVGLYLLALLGYKDSRKAFICALILMSSGIYIGMARIILTDIIFSVLILLSLLLFYRGYVYRERKASGLMFFFTFSAFAVLTKGPLGIIIPLLVIISFLLIKKEIKFLFCNFSLYGFIIFLAISVPWYIYIIQRYGNTFIHEFFYNDHVRRLFEAEHKSNDTWYFYPALIILGMFPWSVYALFSFFKRKLSDVDIFSLCWILVTFLIFQPAHSKLVSYILPLYPAVALLTGDFLLSGRKRLIQAGSGITWFILLLIPAGLILCPKEYAGYLPEKNLLCGYIFVFVSGLVPALFFIIKKKYPVVFYCFTAQIFILLLLVPLAHKNINVYMSSKDAADYLLENYKIDNAIVCSKPFLRGIKYYTGKDVVVWGGDFFSPHSVEHLRSDEAVMDFLKKHPAAYFVIRKSLFEDLERITKDGYKLDLLEIFGEQYAACVMPKK